MSADWQPPKSHPLIPVAGVDRLNEAATAMNEVLHGVLLEGRDWGTMPGSKSPSLGKAGAERLIAAYGLSATYEILQEEQNHEAVVEWEKDVWQNGSKVPGRGTSRGIYSFTVRCTLTDRGRGMVVGQAIGMCSSLESKYIERPRELGNTLIRMAMKRALVGAVSETLNLSSAFSGSLDGSVRVQSTGKPLTGRTQARPAPSPNPSSFSNSSAPPPVQEPPPSPPSPAEPTPGRIAQASGVPFKKVRDGGDLVGWVREDTGQLLRVCPDCRSPMLELTDGFHSCINTACGTVLDNGQVQPAREGMSAEGLSPRDNQAEKRRAADAAELATYAAKWERRREELSWYDWQVEAVVLHLKMKEDWKTWGPRDYKDLIGHVERNAQALVVKAVAQQAKEVPLIPERADLVRVLSAKKGIPLSVMVEVETAILSGWNDPVTTLIDLLQVRESEAQYLDDERQGMKVG